MPAHTTSAKKKKGEKKGIEEGTSRDRMWMKLFKTAEPIEDADSLLYQSRIAYICISQYLLYRRLLPMGVFEKRRIGENAVIHTFKQHHADGSENRWGRKLSEMMRGMTEAIQEKYARQVIIMINEDPSEPYSATEVFTVGLAYSKVDSVTLTDQEGNELASLVYKGKEQFRSQVAYILEKIANVVSKLPALNTPLAKPQMKLTYYDDRTPKDYHPTAFKECDNTYYFKSRPPQLQMGTIGTAHGALTFDLQSHYINNLDELEEEIIQQGAEVMEPWNNSERTVSESLFREEMEVRRSSPPMIAPVEEHVYETAQPPEIFEQEEKEKEVPIARMPSPKKKGPARKQPPRQGKKQLEGGVAKRDKTPAKSPSPVHIKPASPPSSNSAVSTTLGQAKESVTVRKPTTSSRHTESPTAEHPRAKRRIQPRSSAVARDMVKSDADSNSSSKYGEPMK